MASLTDIPALKKEHREIGIGLAAAAGLAMLIAAFTHGWLVNPYRGDIHMGLFSTSACQRHDECASLSNFDLMSKMRDAAERHDTRISELQMEANIYGTAQTDTASEVSSAFAPMGIITMIACVIGGLSLLVIAGLAFKKKRVVVPVQPVTIALMAIMTSLITGCVFIATKPGGMFAVGVGYSFWMFGIGSVVGIVGAQILNKLIKPPDKGWVA